MGLCLWTLMGGILSSIVIANSVELVNKYEPGLALPIVINTWPFYEASEKAWSVISANGSALDAVEQGCTTCEILQCDGTVGYGGSPDENGETTLDAMIMNGMTHEVGAVGALRGIKEAISVARKVMEHTKHTMLVGDQATDFALSMGFEKTSLSTKKSRMLWNSWQNNSCQPNFWKNVYPDPTENCGPYSTKEILDLEANLSTKSEENIVSHDTIGMLGIDSSGSIAGGTSTNGAIHKIPGRVGDSPIAGSGAYVDQEIGGAAATGDGDVMMRFMPSLIAVENMRQGLSPNEAAEDALKRIIKYYPEFSGAVVALSMSGEYGASCYGLENNTFRYCVASHVLGGAQIISTPCIL